MNKLFIRLGEQTIAVGHIARTHRYSDGEVDVWLSNEPESIRLYTSTGEAQAFWDWNTSLLNATTLQIVPESREMAAIS